MKNPHYFYDLDCRLLEILKALNIQMACAWQHSSCNKSI